MSFLAPVAAIAALSCAAAVASEEAARRLIFLQPLFRESVAALADARGKRAAVAASASRASAAGKARDAATLSRAAAGMGQPVISAAFGVAVLSLRATALRSLLPLAALAALALAWPWPSAAALPVAVPWPLALVTHAGVEGADAREVSVAAVWLLAGLLAQHLLLPALMPPPPGGEVSWLTFVGDFVAEQHAALEAPQVAGKKAA